MKMRAMFMAMVFAWGGAQAAIILSENFESYTGGAEMPNTGSVFGYVTADGATSLDVTTDDGSYFGTAGNKYLALIDNGVAQGDNFEIRADDKFNLNLLTVSFDFYQPTVSGQAGDISFIVSGSTTIWDLEIAAGTMEAKAVGLDGKHHIDLTMNNTGSTISYNEENIATEYVGIWVDGVLAGTSRAFLNGRGINATSFKFSANNATVESLYIDNLVVRDETYVIPEPATIGMLSFGSLVALFARRFRNRA